jgi:hypothetical protein
MAVDVLLKLDNSTDLRAAEMPTLEERVKAIEAILLANPSVLRNIPQKAEGVFARISAAFAKFPDRE